jgi:hypothetical protein
MSVIRTVFVGSSSRRDELSLFNTGMILSTIMSVTGMTVHTLGYENISHIVIGAGVGVYISTVALCWIRERSLTHP